jgi:excisionase family DNA binding protein
MSGTVIAHSFGKKRPAIGAFAMKDKEDKEQKPRKKEANMFMAKQQKSLPSILMTVKDVATYLSVTERTVYRLVKDHRLPAYKVGGQWRFKADMIESWMQKDGAMDDLAQAAANAHPATPQYA